MSRDWDKFEKYFNSVQKQIKELSPDKGGKINKRILSWLNETWKMEDALAAAVEAARKDGSVTGSKVADFLKDKRFVAALKTWKDAVAKHHVQINELTDFSNRAQKLHDELAKRCNEIEKEVKKAKATNAKVMDTVKAARKILPDLKKSGALGSSLQGHVVFYARKMQQSVETVIRQVLKKIDPKEFPKSMQEAQRGRTLREVAVQERKIIGLCRAALGERDKDPRKAAKAIKLAGAELSKLKKLNDEVASAAKSMRKEINESKDKKALIDLIKAVTNASRKCDIAFGRSRDAVEKAQAGA